MKWHTEPITHDELVLFQVDLDDGTFDTFVGARGDEDDTMWDIHGCDIGWLVDDVCRWIMLEEVLSQIDGTKDERREETGQG